uniref:Uncharacterized protein n=1 Tax=Panagrolaimus sp. PS1159 TaxID=55785 RepID=A0AC35F0M0_9BILA
MKDFFDLYPMSIDETAEYIAQQGFVVFENTKNSCPLESFTRAKPFKFSNVNEMIYINADYDEKSKKGDMKCIWRFTAPFGYGFKIVILSPAYPGLLIENTTDIILK